MAIVDEQAYCLTIRDDNTEYKAILSGVNNTRFTTDSFYDDFCVDDEDLETVIKFLAKILEKKKNKELP